MIKVLIPNDNIAERKYIIEILFAEFLGLTFSIETQLEPAYKIILPNNSSVTINDHFFSKYNNNTYLVREALPKNIRLVKNEFSVEDDLPVIFGSDVFKKQDNQIECGFDIFASAFFCLTRWEEYVLNDIRDAHNRFPAESSLLYKNNCINRPLVNEYIEFLWNMIICLDSSATRVQNKYQPHFTHDIDLISSPVGIKNFAKDILKHKSIKAFLTRFKYLITGYNPYNMFNYFMDKSETCNGVSHFYFMTGHNERGKDGEDYLKNKAFHKAIADIKKRGHVIGFHPSYNSYNDQKMFKTEKEILENIVQEPILEGRQHVLRFDVPNTWQIWDDNKLMMDSTLGYSSQPGFRCGTGNKFSVFNFLTQQKLSLSELPLIVMDTTLQVNRKMSISESRTTILKYLEIGKKYNMPVTLLFHNCFWDEIEWKGWGNLYESIFVN